MQISESWHLYNCYYMSRYRKLHNVIVESNLNHHCDYPVLNNSRTGASHSIFLKHWRIIQYIDIYIHIYIMMWMWLVRPISQAFRKTNSHTSTGTNAFSFWCFWSLRFDPGCSEVYIYICLYMYIYIYIYIYLFI